MQPGRDARNGKLATEGIEKPPQLVWLRRLYSLRRIVFGSLR